MTVMIVAPLRAVLWMAALTAVITGEKFLGRPYRWSSALAFLLGAVALNVAFAG
jgi:predicted metal-binding membrane protein